MRIADEQDKKRKKENERGNDYRWWAIYTDGVTRVVDGETLAGRSVISRFLHGRIDVMFGLVVTTEAHPAFSGARSHSNNTAEMAAMIEVLTFVGPHGPVANDEQSCIHYDSMHAAGLCLGTIQARTHVQLALACQQSMVRAQHRLRLTMQHVYGHGGNLGDECADHAAALGTFGLVSNHNVSTRWIHHNFDAIACFDGCHNIIEILEGDERVINLQRTKVYVFTDSVLCFGISRCMGAKVAMFEIFFKKENLTESTASQFQLKWNIFQDSIRCSSVKKSKRLLYRLDETPENHKGRILFMSMFNDISCGTKDNET